MRTPGRTGPRVVSRSVTDAFAVALELTLGPLPMLESGVAAVNPLKLITNGVDSPPAGMPVTWSRTTLARAEGCEFVALIEQLEVFETGGFVPTWHVTFVKTSADASPIPNIALSVKAR